MRDSKQKREKRKMMWLIRIVSSQVRMKMTRMRKRTRIVMRTLTRRWVDSLQS